MISGLVLASQCGFPVPIQVAQGAVSASATVLDFEAFPGVVMTNQFAAQGIVFGGSAIFSNNVYGAGFTAVKNAAGPGDQAYRYQNNAGGNYMACTGSVDRTGFFPGSNVPINTLVDVLSGGVTTSFNISLLAITVTFLGYEDLANGISRYQ